MNQRRAKVLRQRSYLLAAEYLKTLLPEDQWEQVNPESVKEFESNQEKHIFDGESTKLAPYSSRWFYQQLKKGRVDFRINEKDLGIDNGPNQVRL